MEKENQETWIKLYERVKLFQRADQLSIKVGLISVPILFGSIGIPILIFMSPSLSYWLGGSIIAVGTLLFLFILSYSAKSRKNAPYVLIGSLINIIKIGASHGETSSILKIKVLDAFELLNTGKGDPVNQFKNSEVNRVFVLKQFQAEEELKSARGEVVFLCVPNGQVVGFYYEGKLCEYLY